MSKLENRQDSGHDIRTLHDDEMETVAGAKESRFSRRAPGRGERPWTSRPRPSA